MPACCRGDVFIAFSECEAFDLHYLVCTMDKKNIFVNFWHLTYCLCCCLLLQDLTEIFYNMFFAFFKTSE